MEATKRSELVKASIVPGLSNGIINGGIQYFILRDKVPLLISGDSISNSGKTILSTAVLLTVILSMFLTLVTYFIIKEAKVPFLPTGFWLIIKHGFLTFCVVTALAVLWQRWVGSFEVTLATGVLMVGVIAALVAGIINYLTLSDCVISDDGSSTLSGRLV